MTGTMMGLVLDRQMDAMGSALKFWEGILGKPGARRPGGEARASATPHDVVYAEGSMRLLHYAREDPSAWSEPLLICSAPVSRPYLLDLRPGRSVVGRMLEAGMDVYLIDWGSASASERGLRLGDLVAGMMRNVAGALLDHCRTRRLHLMGYCLGGTLAAMFAATHPGMIKDLVLMAAPIDFGQERSLLRDWAGQDGLDVDALVDTFGNCPPRFLESTFALWNPLSRIFGRYSGLLEMLPDEGFVEGFIGLEKLLRDRPAMPGEAFREVVKRLYRDNALVRGKLVLDGAPVRLDRIGCPLLLLTATRDHLVAAHATHGILPHVSSRDVMIMSLATGHVELAVGRTAHEGFWPEVARWIADHSTLRPVA